MRSKKNRGDSCYKIGYSKLAHAIDKCKVMSRKEVDQTLRAYRCPRCGQFHVGHDRGRRKQ